jgi:glycerophosphoryl diester phosphodiesterase
MILKIAHRGATNHAPENSLSSIQNAISAGADAVEIDVRLCGSGDVVLHHDSTLERMLGVPDRVISTSFDMIKLVSFKDLQSEHIPSLREVFEKFSSNIFFNVEIKEHRVHCAEIVEKVCKLINEFNLRDSVWVSSFNPFVMRSLKKFDPKIRAGFLFDKVRYIPTLITEYYDVESWHPHYSLVNKEYVDVAKKRGKSIYCWTVNEKEDVKRLISLGIDGIITDNLSLFD